MLRLAIVLLIAFGFVSFPIHARQLHLPSTISKPQLSNLENMQRAAVRPDIHHPPPNKLQRGSVPADIYNPPPKKRSVRPEIYRPPPGIKELQLSESTKRFSSS
ncbi:hypothetical protein O6P43_031535 [Quillaja saponaria]|uniref:Uncharacterized protein n=1 Tax=Quillaja saponaria TaxID=32244 RepID=A0AAD7KWY7_QUISA|nr:hypothetical protein O6P43_031535 [Quillaja saponaria]